MVTLACRGSTWNFPHQLRIRPSQRAEAALHRWDIHGFSVEGSLEQAVAPAKTCTDNSSLHEGIGSRTFAGVTDKGRSGCSLADAIGCTDGICLVRTSRQSGTGFVSGPRLPGKKIIWYSDTNICTPQAEPNISPETTTV